MTKRMKELIAWIRRVCTARATTPYPSLYSNNISDTSLIKLISEMFVGWYKLPVMVRAEELKGLLRYVAAHSLKKCYNFATKYNTVPYHIIQAMYYCPTDQTTVNHVINRRGDCWRGDRWFREAVEELLKETTTAKLKAIKNKVSQLREVGTDYDGFNDWWITHPVKIQWNGKMIAETWVHQVGACARAHGKVEWKYYDGWDEMLNTQGKEGWPSFAVDKTTTEETYMVVI